jgi:PTS system mannose-specific IIC component
MLPALGIAMNLKLIGNSFTMPFFVLGVILSVYFKQDILIIAIMGVVLALTVTSLRYSGKKDVNV